MSLEWMQRGLCREVDMDLFFPESHQTGEIAKRVCRKCEVINECLQYAIETRSVGIWGGTSENQRIKLRRLKHVA